MAGEMRPLPVPTPETKHFWEGTRAGELRLQRCDDCRHTYFPPRPFCPKCASRKRVARGSSEPAYRDRLRYVARIDADVFAAISAFAESRSLSFNRALGVLALRGLSAARREVPASGVPLPSASCTCHTGEVSGAASRIVAAVPVWYHLREDAGEYHDNS